MEDWKKREIAKANRIMARYDVVKVISRWDTSHECQLCLKDFCGDNAALIRFDGEDAIICSQCLEEIEELRE